MSRSFRCLTPVAIAALGLLSVWPGLVAAKSSPQQATVESFVGTWTCVTRSSDNKTFRETDVDSMYGNWLRINASYPAQNGAPAGTGVTFFGYDGKNKRWVVSGVGTDGSYFIATSTSPTFNGAKFADQYPNDHGIAVLHMTKSTEYSMDTQGPNEKGKMMTQHVACTKQ